MNALEAYRNKFDEEFVSGDLKLIEEAFKILKERQRFVEDYIMKMLKKPFDLNESHTLETDPEKRKICI